MSLKELIHFVYNVSFVGIELLPFVFYFCDMFVSFVHFSVFFSLLVILWHSLHISKYLGFINKCAANVFNIILCTPDVINFL